MDKFSKLLNPMEQEEKKDLVQVKDYKPDLEKFLASYEGFVPKMYKDSRGNETFGYGFIANEENLGIAGMLGYTPERLRDEGMSEEDAKKMKRIIIDKYEQRLDKDLNGVFQTLPENKKTALSSLHYNSPALIGPNAKQYIANNDDLGLAREIVLNSNSQNEPGVLRRRLDEAALFADLPTLGKTLSLEEKKKISSGLQQLPEGDRELYLQKYSQPLGLAPESIAFKKLINK